MKNGFARELDRHGPHGAQPLVTPAEAQVYCSRLAKRHYENFTVASFLLPGWLQRHFHAIYAYCRWADDLGDETGGGARALALLQWWRDELMRCYDGSPRHPVMVALRGTIRRFHIPANPFLDLLSAFEQDQMVKNYATYPQLLDYCRRSANPVGHLVLYLCEVHTPERARLADDICTALQLTNFWQDVARDLDIGRVYLPEEDRQRFGYSDDDLRERRFTPAFAELMRFEVERARGLFERGAALLPLMPEAVGGDVELFVRGGLGILKKIDQVRYNVWKKRPVLTKWEKASLLAPLLWRKVKAAL